MRNRGILIVVACAVAAATLAAGPAMAGEPDYSRLGLAQRNPDRSETFIYLESSGEVVKAVASRRTAGKDPQKVEGYLEPSERVALDAALAKIDAKTLKHTVAAPDWTRREVELVVMGFTGRRDDRWGLCSSFTAELGKYGDQAARVTPAIDLLLEIQRRFLRRLDARDVEGTVRVGVDGEVWIFAKDGAKLRVIADADGFRALLAKAERKLVKVSAVVAKKPDEETGTAEIDLVYGEATDGTAFRGPRHPFFARLPKANPLLISKFVSSERHGDFVTVRNRFVDDRGFELWPDGPALKHGNGATYPFTELSTVSWFKDPPATGHASGAPAPSTPGMSGLVPR